LSVPGFLFFKKALNAAIIAPPRWAKYAITVFHKYVAYVKALFFSQKPLHSSGLLSS
jgi:hypothetical protein